MLKIKSFQVHYESIYQKIILIESIYKSEADINSIERLNISNSKKYLDFIKKRKFEFLYNVDKMTLEEINKNKALNSFVFYDSVSNEFFKNYELTENLKREFILKHFEFLDEFSNAKNAKDKQSFVYDHKISPEEVFINIFKNDNISINNEYRATLDMFQDSSQNSSMVERKENDANNQEGKIT